MKESVVIVGKEDEEPVIPGYDYIVFARHDSGSSFGSDGPLLTPKGSDGFSDSGQRGFRRRTKSASSYLLELFNRYKRRSAKSQSVDSHGYVNPLETPSSGGQDQQQPEQDINTNTTSSEIPLTPTSKVSPDQSDNPSSPSEKKTLTRTLTQPQNTVEYVVSASDTLNGIAARFDTTPSELVKLNRLVSRFIFKGQTLYIPKKGEQFPPSEGSFDGGQKSPMDKEKSMSPKPGHVERVQSPSPVSKSLKFFGGSSSLGSSTEEKEQIGGGPPSAPDIEVNGQEQNFDVKCPERFLKINSKHITDGQGFVSGVLLVTPNALMFDPNVSDILVMEHGVELYGVIAPIDMMIRAAIYFDIAHMRVKDAQDSLNLNSNKPKIYSGPGTSPAPALEEPLLAEDKPEKPDIPDLICFEQILGSECDNQMEKTLDSFDLVMPNTSGSDFNLLDHQDAKQQRSDSIEVMVSTPPPDLITEGVDNIPANLPQSDSDVTLATTLTQEESEEVLNAEKLSRSATVREGSRNTQSRRERMLKRLSYPVESLSSYTQSSISKILSSSPRNLVDFSSTLFVRSGGAADGEKDDSGLIESVAEDSKNAAPDAQLINVGYKNMVEEKPDFFAEVDKLFPRPARQYEGQPLYLCLRMGQPLNKKVQWSTPIASYSKKRMKKEYWFSIPRARVDDLYNFFQHWCPDVYGDVDEVAPEERGFKPIESDPEDDDEDLLEISLEKSKSQELEVQSDGRKKSIHGPLSFLKLVEGHFTADGSNSPFDWELVSMSEAEHSPETDLPLPDLSDYSEIFTEEHRKELCKNLPARAEGYPWSLIYSTSKNGFSLKTMYREMAKYETPVLLGITDTQGTVFGAVISCSLKISDHFYGTGESFLFSFHPTFKCYHWTGENMYFIKGNAESLAIGAGDGMFGIWLDGDLFHGRSHCCKTFGNEAPLSSQEDFVVRALEAWGFV